MNKVKDILFNSGGNIVYLACTWLMTIAVVRLADFDTAGVFSLAMTITVVFYSISNYGIRSFQVSDVSNEYSDQEYMMARIFTCLSGWLLCASYCLINGYSNRQVIVILLYMLYKTIEAFSDLSYGYFQKYNHFDYVFYSLCAKGILTISLFSASLWLIPNIYLALSAIAIGTAILYFGYDLHFTKKLIHPITTWNKYTCNKSLLLLKRTLILVLINTMAPLLNAIPRVYFEAHTSSELYGYYFSISSPTVIISTFVGCVLLPLVPLFADAYQKNDMKKAVKLLMGCVFFTVMLGVVCHGLSLVLGNFALELLYTDVILQYSYTLQAIIWATVCSALVMCFNLYFIAIRKQKYLVGALLIGCASAYIATPSFVDSFSMQGVSYTLILAQLLQCIFMLALVVYDVTQKKKNTHI